MHGLTTEGVPPKDNGVTTASSTTILPACVIPGEKEITEIPPMQCKKMQQLYARMVAGVTKVLTATRIMSSPYTKIPTQSNEDPFMPS